ncbi:Myrcene synthase [Morus notabilis]|uniref:Myrcene synthase n=1 Tax=Morus notabilis TaxID=981085 RepID=W9SSI4_9ROSA|nr:Myrcene synthase [Morus notabilis]
MAYHTVQFSTSLSICTSFISRSPALSLYPAAPFPTSSIQRLRSTTRVLASSRVQCVADNSKQVSNINGENIARRSANYQPPLWKFDYVQSLGTQYTKESLYAERVENLKDEEREILKTLEGDHIAQLEHIDILQRLGISYHFEAEIQSVLEEIYTNYNNMYSKKNMNLYATALEFRILRQHGYQIPQEVFNAFRDEKTGKFSTDDHTMAAMLSLYEASFHMVEVSHALELPLHWRTPRLESRWFIDMYERRQDMNPSLLELAKLDFNIVQSTHQEDLKHAYRWWRKTGLGKLEFARDRLMENLLLTLGFAFEPQFSSYRRLGTKVNAFVTLIDDIYDVYGTLDELELFTDAVERWDTSGMDQLPDYMRMCFLAFHNFVNDTALEFLKEHGIHYIKYLKKAWADLCKSYLVEAKWYYSGYTPTFQEYIDNAWISFSVPVILVNVYVFAANPTTKEALTCLEEYPSIIRQSGILCRFLNDLETSLDEIKRGDVPKSIQCYMHEAGVSEEKARQHIKLLIRETWKKINEDRVADSSFSKTFTEIATNVVRMAQSMYLHGDGYAIQDRETKELVMSLLVDPIPLKSYP